MTWSSEWNDGRLPRGCHGCRWQHLALRWRTILRGDVNWSLVIGRTLFEPLELKLKLALSLLGRFEFGFVCSKSSLLFFRFPFCGLFPTFLLLFLNLALPDLFLKSSKTRLLRLLLSL